MSDKIEFDRVPSADRNLFLRDTIRAVRDLFERPGVKEDYEIWLAEYRRTHPNATEAG